MTESAAQPTCPTCKSPLPADAPGGACPRCLMALAFATDAGAVTPDVAAADVASRFPGYEVTGTIGRGGMGVVFRARQKALDREVALKVLPGGAARPPGFAERFAREAKALARLQHPGIVQVFDFGASADGWCFLAMELVEGVNLRKMLADGRIPSKAALAIVPQICDALQYAHDHGVVHRDIKPENVLVTPDGRVKIADFGLAKLVLEARGALLTQTGVSMGTPLYMAPEQVEHPAEVDHRADIYSLGVVFYEMLTGELPLGRFAPPSKKTDVDARIDDIVLKTLEKEREARFQRVAEVKTKIDEAGVPPPLVPPPPVASALPPRPPMTGPRIVDSAADRAADAHVAHFVSPGPHARVSKFALAIPVLAAIAFVTVGENSHSVAQTLMFTAPVLLGLLALSLVAWGRIRRSEGRKYGTGYAAIGIVAALVLAVAAPFVVASRRSQYATPVGTGQRWSQGELETMREDQDAIRQLVERAMALRPITDPERLAEFYAPDDVKALRTLSDEDRAARGAAGQLGLPLASDAFLGEAANAGVYVQMPSAGPTAKETFVTLQAAGVSIQFRMIRVGDSTPEGWPVRSWRFTLAPLTRTGTPLRNTSQPPKSQNRTAAPPVGGVSGARVVDGVAVPAHVPDEGVMEYVNGPRIEAEIQRLQTMLPSSDVVLARSFYLPEDTARLTAMSAHDRAFKADEGWLGLPFASEGFLGAPLRSFRITAVSIDAAGESAIVTLQDSLFRAPRTGTLPDGTNIRLQTVQVRMQRTPERIDPKRRWVFVMAPVTKVAGTAVAPDWPRWR